MITRGREPDTRLRSGGGLASVRSMRAMVRESMESALKRFAMCL